MTLPKVDAVSSSRAAGQPLGSPDEKRRSTKCLVWDLDNTLWDGVLLEDGTVRLREGARELIEELDRRGILLSIASKNDAQAVNEALKRFELDSYFLYPQVNWGPKSESIRNIARELNIGLDAIALLDDQEFERDEVNFALPQVLCIDSADLARVGSLPELKPRFLTDESGLRRKMYLDDIKRNQAEQVFAGTSEQFLSSLGMRLTIARARKEDLRRAEELTVRTNQLNTTGYTYSYDDLALLLSSNRHLVCVAGLDDRYGSYGKIGLSLVELDAAVWTIKLLLMSCRVMSRGVGTVMVRHIMHAAKDAGVRLQAEFISNQRNRAMLVTYMFEGFRESGQAGAATLLEGDLSAIRPYPGYLKLDLEPLASSAAD
jgi:FkbH-like protein